MKINTDALVKEMHRVCGDTSHSPAESLEAYEDIEADARTSAIALREEIGEEDE